MSNSLPISILIIDDNTGDQLLLQENLTSTNLLIGEIVMVETLKQGIKNLEQKSFSLIFLDLFLPDSTGLESFTELLKTNSRTPVIIYSGLADSEVALNAITSGAQDFLIKGDYSLGLLEKTIRYSIERKTNLDALEESNTRYNFISKATNDMVWDWDLISGHVYRNVDGWKKIFKNTDDAEVDTEEDWKRRLHPGDKEKSQKLLEEALNSDQDFYEAENRLLRDDGDYAYILDRGYILRNSEGKPIRLIGAAQDITERKAAEEKIMLSEQRFKSLVQNSADLLAILNIAGEYIYVSPTSEKILGIKPEEFIGKSAFDFIYPDDKEKTQALLQESLSKKNVQVPPFRFKNAAGEWRWIESTITNLLEDKSVLGIVVNSRDITDQKLAEENAAKQKIIKQKEITDAVIAAQENERSEIGRELHDNINQLLGATRLYIDMGKKDDENRTSLLASASTYTLTAIEEIRKLSKTLITPLIKTMGLIDSVKDMIEDIEAVHTIKINLKATNFDHDKLNEKFKLNIFRIVQEQINNTLKHAQAKTINIKFDQTVENIFITITDDGVGFDVKERKKGIGISNIVSRAELYNGDVKIMSQPGKGCTLSINFPVSNLVL